MAKINFGSLATDARGKLAGMIFSANRGGAYVRRKASPTGTATPAQALVRNNFAKNSKIWSGILTASQRQAWTFFAQANPRVNVFGNSITLSGMAMMQSLNQILLQIGVAPIENAPTDMSVPTLAAAIGGDIESTGPVVEVTTAAQTVVAGAKYYVFATGNLSAGATPQKNQYRFVGAYAGVAAATMIDISTLWQAAFGNPISGATVGLLVATVNTATGAVTPGLKFILTVG